MLWGLITIYDKEEIIFSDQEDSNQERTFSDVFLG